jgi:hypothetical protein
MSRTFTHSLRPRRGLGLVVVVRVRLLWRAVIVFATTATATYATSTSAATPEVSTRQAKDSPGDCGQVRRWYTYLPHFFFVGVGVASLGFSSSRQGVPG